MNVVYDREKGTITTHQREYTEDVIKHFGMKGCNSVYKSVVEPELSLNQPEEKLLDEEDKKRYQSITGTVMYLGQIFRYAILFAVNQLAGQCPILQKCTRKRPSTYFATLPVP